MGKKKGGAAKQAEATKAAKSPLISSAAVSMVGLLALGVIAVMMLRHQLDLQQAAIRAGVVFGVLLLTDRLLLPIARTLVGPSKQ